MCLCAVDWRRWLAVVVFCAELIGLGGISVGYAERIVAVVGDEVITEFDLEQVINEWRYSGMVSGEDEDNNLMDIKKEALNRLIEEKLLFLEAKSRHIEVSSDLVEKRFEEIKSRFSSEEDFNNSLRKVGLTKRDLLDRIRRQIMISRLISTVIRPRIYVSPEEITEEFDKNRNKFCKVNRVNISSIFIPKGDLSEMDFELLVMDEYMKLKDGLVTWRDLEAKYGEGEIKGWKKASDLSPEMAKILFKADAPKYPRPVRVSTGYILFRLEQMDKDCPKALGKVKGRVYDYLYQKKFQKEMESFISELKDKYYVRVYT